MHIFSFMQQAVLNLLNLESAIEVHNEIEDFRIPLSVPH